MNQISRVARCPLYVHIYYDTFKCFSETAVLLHYPKTPWKSSCFIFPLGIVVHRSNCFIVRTGSSRIWAGVGNVPASELCEKVKLSRGEPVYFNDATECCKAYSVRVFCSTLSRRRTTNHAFISRPLGERTLQSAAQFHVLVAQKLTRLKGNSLGMKSALKSL